MSVTTFTVVNGQVMRQVKDGVVHDFVPDPLGSVVMVQDAAGDVVYRAEYDPYGNVQSETGTNPSSLGYVGTLGYIKDSATSMYVRARYLLNNLGRWLTKDPLWPSEPGYVYAGAAPNMRVDPSGMKPASVPYFGPGCGVGSCQDRYECCLDYVNLLWISIGLAAIFLILGGAIAGCVAVCTISVGTLCFACIIAAAGIMLWSILRIIDEWHKSRDACEKKYYSCICPTPVEPPKPGGDPSPWWMPKPILPYVAPNPFPIFPLPRGIL